MGCKITEIHDEANDNLVIRFRGWTDLYLISAHIRFDFLFKAHTHKTHFNISWFIYFIHICMRSWSTARITILFSSTPPIYAVVVPHNPKTFDVSNEFCGNLATQRPFFISFPFCLFTVCFFLWNVVVVQTQFIRKSLLV